MNLVLGLVGLALIGAEGQRAPEIIYDVRVVTMHGLDWRREFFARLQPVANQHGATVWTTGLDTATTLAGRDPAALKVPRVTAASMTPAHVSNRTSRKIVNGSIRRADASIDHATRVAYTPQYDLIREGFMMTVAGRKLDQGVLACVILDETHIAAIHRLSMSETVKSQACCPEGKDGVALTKACADSKETFSAKIEVPEIAQSSVAGEWLIPNGGALVVSLGPHSSVDENGKTEVAERLVLIEAAAKSDAAVVEAEFSFSGSLVPDQDQPKEQIPPQPLAQPSKMPPLPSQTLPRALKADGTEHALPPLPGEPPPTTLPGTSEPAATPQTALPKSEPAPAEAPDAVDDDELDPA